MSCTSVATVPAFRPASGLAVSGIYAGSLLAAIGSFVPFVHLVPFATAQGVSPQTAVWLLATIGITSTLGRFALGGLADRLGRARSLALMVAAMALALGFWSMASSVAVLLVFAAALELAHSSASQLP